MLKCCIFIGVYFLWCMLIAYGDNRRSDVDIEEYCEVLEIDYIHYILPKQFRDCTEIRMNDKIMLTFYLKSDIQIYLLFYTKYMNNYALNLQISIEETVITIITSKRFSKSLSKHKYNLLSPDEWHGFWVLISAEGTVRSVRVGEIGNPFSLISSTLRSDFSHFTFAHLYQEPIAPHLLAFHCKDEIDIEEKCKIFETSCVPNISHFSIDARRTERGDFLVQFYVKFGSMNTYLRLSSASKFSDSRSILLDITSDSIDFSGFGIFPEIKACEPESSSTNNSAFPVRAWESYWFRVDFSRTHVTIGKKYKETLNRTFYFPEEWQIKYFSFVDVSGNTKISLAHECNFESAKYNSIIDESDSTIYENYSAIFENSSAIIENSSATIENNNSFIVENNSKNDDKSRFTTLIMDGIIIVFAIVVSGCSCFWYKRKKKIMSKKMDNANAFNRLMKTVIIQRKEHFGNFLQTPLVKIELNSIESGHNAEFCENSEYKMIEDSPWEFSKGNLKLGELLGEGEFGQVFKAEGYSIVKPNTWSTIAVKMLKDQHTDEEMITLVSEMEIMKLIGNHQHILRLLGCCTQQGPLFIIMEYADHGNLKDFLRDRLPNKHKLVVLEDGSELNKSILISFAKQIAEGMEYLSSIRLIHRDLAARNVLVCKKYVMKIADFGLARDIYENDYYKKETRGKLPIKWMPPEAIFHRLYTCQSDVWSYGILLWEIMTFGGIPYPTISNGDEIITLLREGYRMEAPPNCPSKLYELMKNCWNYDANDRPTFSKILEILNEILADNIEMPEVIPLESATLVHNNVIFAEVHELEFEKAPLLN